MSIQNEDTNEMNERKNEQELLEVTDLHTYFRTDDEPVRAVDGISFSVAPGETVAIVGESGSGKTVTSESITRLFQSPPGYIPKGSVKINGKEVTTMNSKELRNLRGQVVSHIFQNPQNALNPVYTVGWQIMEALQLHQNMNKDAARERAIELLTEVGIPNASSRITDYPHELSGGMKQRIIIAIALACEPELLIADEPTTALDVTIQAQILDLFRELQEKTQMGILFITHDLGVVAEIADRVIVMYSGKIMEQGPVNDIYKNPAHPYTRALLECLPGGGSLGGIPGELPDPKNPPSGCRFASRCPYAVDVCFDGDQPDLYDAGTHSSHHVSCVHYQQETDPEKALSERQFDEEMPISDRSRRTNRQQTRTDGK